MKSIKSLKEFRKRYFPKEYLENKLDKMSAGELGKYHANKILKKLEKK